MRIKTFRTGDFPIVNSYADSIPLEDNAGDISDIPEIDRRKISSLIYSGTFNFDFKLQLMKADHHTDSSCSNETYHDNLTLFSGIRNEFPIRPKDPKKSHWLNESNIRCQGREHNEFKHDFSKVNRNSKDNIFFQTESESSEGPVLLESKHFSENLMLENAVQGDKCYNWSDQSQKGKYTNKKYSISKKICNSIIHTRKRLDSTLANTSIVSNIQNQAASIIKMNKGEIVLTKSEIVNLILSNEKSAHLLKSFFQKIKIWIKYKKYINIALFFTSDNRYLITLKCLPQAQVRELVMKCVLFDCTNFKEFYQTLQIKEFYPMKESIEVRKLSNNYRFLKSIVTVEKGKIKIATINETPKSRKISLEDYQDCLVDASGLKLKTPAKAADLIKANFNCIGNFKKPRYSIYTNQSIAKDAHEVSLSLEDNEICARVLNDLDLSLHLSNLKEKESSRMLYDSSNFISAHEICNNECSYENSHSKSLIKEKFNSMLKTRSSNIGYTNQEELLKDISVNSFHSSSNDEG